MPPQTYQKLVATQFSDKFLDCLAVIDTPYTPPAANEITVQNHYAGANFTDIPMLMGRSHMHATPPFDLGIEAAGEVVAVGSAVTDFKVGDQVVTVMYGNGYREYSNIDSKLAMQVDKATPEMLAVYVAGATASIALHVTARMRSDQTVLVTAAAGSSGQFAVQLAKLAGNHVIGTCGSSDEADILTGLGCDRVINRGKEDLNAVLTEEYPDGINLIYESFGGHIFDTCLDHLSVRGRLIIAGVIAEYTKHESAIHAVRIYDKLLWKSATLHGFLLPDYGQFFREHAGKLLNLYREGKIQAIVDPTPFRGLKSVGQALEYLSGWQSCGKVVIEIAE